MNKFLVVSVISVFLLSLAIAVDWRGNSPVLNKVPQFNVIASGEIEGVGDAAQQLAREVEPVELDSFDEFDQWYSSIDAGSDGWLRHGVELAKRRAGQMKRLMSENPALALNKALSFSEYASLPVEVAQWVEKPFSAAADLVVLPVEPRPDGSAPILDESEVASISIEGSDFEVDRFGRRAEVESKNSMAAQGFTLANAALLDDKPLRIVTGTEANYVTANFPSRDADVDAYTGEVIDTEPVVAIGGGEVFYFAEQSNLIALNNDLLALEQRPGPYNGSPVLFKSLAEAGYSEQVLEQQGASVDAPLVEQLFAAKMAVNPWTNTKKDVFFIRIDFSDKPGEPVTQAALTDILNNGTSDQFRDMSRGRTWIEADVSAMVVRMPNESTTYNPNTLYTAALSAFNDLNTGTNLGDYDIVGLFFTDIDTPETDFNFSGLAGGSRQWIQDSTNVYLFVHEFGHNYGLGHASFWQTSDGSSVGAGANDEYGNIYDIMGDGLIANGYFHPQGLERLDWIDTDEWTEVTSSGLHRIHRFDDPLADNVQTLRITKGDSEYYWLGHRQRINNPYLRGGLQLLWQRPFSGRSWLVDTTPGSGPGKEDTAITLGRTYQDTASDIFITPLAQGGSAPNEWVDVQVNLGSFPGNQAPSVAISGAATANAREQLVFTATASDPNGDDLAYQWDFGDGVIHPSASEVQHSWLVGGTYTVTVTVSDMKGQTASDSMQVTVSDPVNNWSQRTSGTTRDLNDIATDGSVLIAVGDRGVILRSTDNGASWSGGAILQSGSGGSVSVGNLNFYGVDYSDSLWIAVGRDFDSVIDPDKFIGQVFTSADGLTWRRRVDGGAPFSDIASNGSVRVATGTDGRISRSTDGIGWQESTSNTAKIIDGVAYGNGKYVAVGGWQRSGNFNRTTVPAIVLSSGNGVSWSDVSASTGFSFQGLDQIEFLNNLFVANGFYSSLRYSSDGESFETAYADRQDRFSAFAYGNGVYFAGGQDSGGDINLVSADGQQWSNAAVFSQPNRNAAIFFADTFITVGDSGSIYQTDAVPEPVVSGPNQDGDFYADADDNCPAVPNNDQLDTDGDDQGNACDTDDDNDMVLDASDCAPLDAAAYQTYMAYLDADNDAVGTGSLQAVCGGDTLTEGYTQAATGDNCPAVSNASQTNTDDDSMGDACDNNDDNDIALDADDCAPLNDMQWQFFSAYLDVDEDEVGSGALLQVCGGAALPAGYTVAATSDNCPTIGNADQLNTDNDALGNECDDDQDNDGVLNGADDDALDPKLCEDSDTDSCNDCAVGSDGFGPLADNLPNNDGLDTDGNGVCNVGDNDDDNDGVLDGLDNCDLVANEDQADSDDDGVGDACQALTDADDILDFLPAIISATRAAKAK